MYVMAMRLMTMSFRSRIQFIRSVYYGPADVDANLNQDQTHAWHDGTTHYTRACDVVSRDVTRAYMKWLLLAGLWKASATTRQGNEQLFANERENTLQLS